MSTGSPNAVLDSAFAAVDAKFRTPILKYYVELKRRFHTGDVDGAGTAATQFCEDVLRLLQEIVKGPGKSTPPGSHFNNFGKACEDIINLPPGTFDDALRVLVPRGLVFLHSMRSKRGFVHTPGTVSANLIDLATMARLADWVLAELLRTQAKMDLGAAQALIDSLSYRDLPDLWRINGKTRVLRKGLKYADRVLLILYDMAGEAVLTEDLFDFVQHSNCTVFRRDVLRKLHRDGLIEFDEDDDAATISPTGSAEVEGRILST